MELFNKNQIVKKFSFPNLFYPLCASAKQPSKARAASLPLPSELPAHSLRQAEQLLPPVAASLARGKKQRARHIYVLKHIDVTTLLVGAVQTIIIKPFLSCFYLKVRLGFL